MSALTTSLSRQVTARQHKNIKLETGGRLDVSVEVLPVVSLRWRPAQRRPKGWWTTTNFPARTKSRPNLRSAQSAELLFPPISLFHPRLDQRTTTANWKFACFFSFHISLCVTAVCEHRLGLVCLAPFAPPSQPFGNRLSYVRERLL